jgi:predicted metal-binding protein
MIIVPGKIVSPVIDPSVRSLCCRPYPGHPKGCPNFNHRVNCPPKAPLWDEVFDITKPTYIIINQFDFGAHVERMKQLHLDWSDRQLECCLYWQNTDRKELRAGIAAFKKLHPEYIVEECPEAMGINVTKTTSQVGVELEWPPKKFVHHVALAGIRDEG